MGVLGDAGLDVGEGFEGEFFAFLGDFGGVDDFGAFGSRHCEWWWGGVLGEGVGFWDLGVEGFEEIISVILNVIDRAGRTLGV